MQQIQTPDYLKLGQGQHLSWINKQKVRTEEECVENYSEIMDRFGAVLVRIAVLLGAMVVAAQIGIWRGWW